MTPTPVVDKPPAGWQARDRLRRPSLLAESPDMTQPTDPAREVHIGLQRAPDVPLVDLRTGRPYVLDRPLSISGKITVDVDPAVWDTISAEVNRLTAARYAEQEREARTLVLGMLLDGFDRPVAPGTSG